MAATKGQDIWNGWLKWIEAQFSMIIPEDVQVETPKETGRASHVNLPSKSKPRRRDQAILRGRCDQGSFKARRLSGITKRQDGQSERARRGSRTLDLMPVPKLSRSEARCHAPLRRSSRLQRAVTPTHHAHHSRGKRTLPPSCKTSSKQNESHKSCNNPRRSSRIVQLKAIVDGSPI